MPTNATTPSISAPRIDVETHQRDDEKRAAEDGKVSPVSHQADTSTRTSRGDCLTNDAEASALIR